MSRRGNLDAANRNVFWEAEDMSNKHTLPLCVRIGRKRVNFMNRRLPAAGRRLLFRGRPQTRSDGLGRADDGQGNYTAGAKKL